MKNLTSLIILFGFTLVLAGCSFYPSPAKNNLPTVSPNRRQVESNSFTPPAGQKSGQDLPQISSKEINKLIKSETHIITTYSGSKVKPETVTAKTGDYIVVKNSDTIPHEIQLGSTPAAKILSGSAQINELKQVGEYPVRVDGTQLGLVKVQ